MNRVLYLGFVVALTAATAFAAEIVPQEANTWTKRSPLKDAPPSPDTPFVGEWHQ